MIKATRLANAAFLTPDVGRMVDYYERVVGLVVAHREPDGTTYMTTGRDLHCIVLRPSDQNRLDRVALSLPEAVSAADAVAGLKALGVDAQIATDAEPNVRECVDLLDAEGHRVRLLAGTGGSGAAESGRGYAPQKLGHLARRVRDPQAAVDFYERALGFRVSDWIGDFFVFLRCNSDHHALNFVASDNPGDVHHLAFQLHDHSHLAQACDLLAREGTPLIWGPGRHGAGHNIYAYYRDPDGHIVELFLQLDQMLDEELGYFDPRPWHVDFPQYPKVWDPESGANLWGIGAPAEMHS